jgi:hypothetical protein
MRLMWVTYLIDNFGRGFFFGFYFVLFFYCTTENKVVIQFFRVKIALRECTVTLIE